MISRRSDDSAEKKEEKGSEQASDLRLGSPITLRGRSRIAHGQVNVAIVLLKSDSIVAKELPRRLGSLLSRIRRHPPWQIHVVIDNRLNINQNRGQA